MSTARRSTSLQQHRTEHRLSSRRAVGLIRTRKHRPSNELRERALQTSPDASRQRRSTPGGINAAITDSSVCNTQPTLQFNTAEAKPTGKRLSALEPDPRLTRRRFVNTLRNKPPEHPKEDSSPRQSEEGLGVGTRALTTTSSTSHVTRHHREDRATSRAPIKRAPEAQDNSYSGRYAARQAADLRK